MFGHFTYDSSCADSSVARYHRLDNYLIQPFLPRNRETHQSRAITDRIARPTHGYISYAIITLKPGMQLELVCNSEHRVEHPFRSVAGTSGARGPSRPIVDIDLGVSEDLEMFLGLGVECILR